MGSCRPGSSSLYSLEFRAGHVLYHFVHYITLHYITLHYIAVRTVKCLFEKCKETGVSEFQALIDWRNTPSEGMDTSPAQRLMGRQCRTLLPMSESLL